MAHHVEADLLAYLDDELSAADRSRVEAHLEHCAACTAHLEELRRLRADLGATLEVALDPVRLGYDADRTIRRRLRAAMDRPRWWLALWPRRGVLAQAMLAILVLFLSVVMYPNLKRPAVPPVQETLLLGQNRFAPGTDAALRVVVRSAETAVPMAGARVLVTLSQAPGITRRVYDGITDRQGTADVAFTIPESMAGQAELIVETKPAVASGENVPTGRIVRPITIARAYKIYLSSDKPAYRPGHTVHLRALVLDANTLRPVSDSEVSFVVLNPEGHSISLHQRKLSEYGVASADVVLAEDTPAGGYTLRAMLGDTVSERTITVGEYALPAFRVSFETDRSFYAPGKRMYVSGEAAYFFGKAVSNAVVIVRGYTDADAERPFVEEAFRTEMDGHFEATFMLPDDVGLGDEVLLNLEVEVTDEAGQMAGLRKFIPVALQPIVIKAVPESGELKPGLENTVYLMTAYADGTPAETTLTVTTAITRLVLHTDPYGLAEFLYTPEAGQGDFELEARDISGLYSHVTLSLPVDEATQMLLLHAEQATYEVGETLRLETLLSSRASVVYLDVVRAQQTVAALSSPVENGRATFALDLDASLVGTLELHAYSLLADGTLLEDTRLVVVDAPRQVQVAVQADKADYHPGETANVSIQTSLEGLDDTPAPVRTQLGIAIVDASLYALDTLPPGFARTYFLLQDAELQGQTSIGGADVTSVLAAKDEARRAQDVAVQASWAVLPSSDFSLHASGTTTMPPAELVAQNRWTWGLGLLLCVLPLWAGQVVTKGLLTSGVTGSALRRLGLLLIGLLVFSPLVIVAGILGVLVPLFGSAVFAATLGFVLLGLLAFAVYGWLRRDPRAQLVAGIFGAYLVVGGILLLLSTRIEALPLLLTASVMATALFFVLVLALLGQGLVLEGRRGVGWLATLLALLLVILLATLASVPALTSDLTRTLSAPGVYVGPLGWISGCSTPTPQVIVETVVVKETVEVEVEKTVEVMKTAEPSESGQEPTEIVTEEPTEEPTTEVEPTSEATVAPPTPAGETPLPTATTIPVLVPAEPYPLRHVFPETLYWAPEVVSDPSGYYAFDVALADTLTTWRLTALATTRDGNLGAATYDLVVFQDFFAELSVPETITVGHAVTVTATLYNYTDKKQTVLLRPLVEDWYTLHAAPEALDIPAKSVQRTELLIRLEQSGTFSLQVDVVGVDVYDAVAVDVTVASEGD